jgi:hypothetical protein
MEQYYSGKVIAIICGIGGGMGRYLLQTDATYLIKLSQAGVTALVCGLLGAAGKYLFDLMVKQLKK